MVKKFSKKVLLAAIMAGFLTAGPVGSAVAGYFPPTCEGGYEPGVVKTFGPAVIMNLLITADGSGGATVSGSIVCKGNNLVDLGLSSGEFGNLLSLLDTNWEDLDAEDFYGAIFDAEDFATFFPYVADWYALGELYIVAKVATFDRIGPTQVSFRVILLPGLWGCVPVE